MLFFHSYKSPGLVLDIVPDIRGMNDATIKAAPRKTGMIVLGGGECGVRGCAGWAQVGETCVGTAWCGWLSRYGCAGGSVGRELAPLIRCFLPSAAHPARPPPCRMLAPQGCPSTTSTTPT